MKTKFKLLSIIALLASTMFIQACGPAINFTPLTKEEVKKLDDAGDKWTKDAMDLIQKFGFEQVDMKAVSLAFLKDSRLTAKDQKILDNLNKVTPAVELKKDSKEVVAVIKDKDALMVQVAGGVQIDATNANNTPKGVYLESLRQIAQAGAYISKTTLEDELARVESKADVKIAGKEIKVTHNVITSIYHQVYIELIK